MVLVFVLRAAGSATDRDTVKGRPEAVFFHPVCCDRRFEFGLLRPTPELSPAQEAVISESYRG